MWKMLALTSLVIVFGALPWGLFAADQNVKGNAPPAAEKAKAGTLPAADEEVAVLDMTIDGKPAGRIVLRFFPEKAPGHVENFKKLARQEFYDGTKFHRVIPGFMIQGGDPNSKDNDRSNDGMGGPGYAIKAEFNDLPHNRGTLSMARTSDPNSAGSQFFICVARAASLDRQYTVFGEAIEGLDLVDKIVALERDNRDNPLKPATIKHASIVKFGQISGKAVPPAKATPAPAK